MACRLLFAFIFFAPIFLSGCQGPSTEQYPSTDEFVVEQQDNIQTKKIRFQTPLLGVNSKEHFLVRFRFLNEESQLILQSHFSGFSLDDGIKIRLYPEAGELVMKVSSPGFPEREAVVLGDLKGSDEVQLRIEVHDGVSSGARILVWEDMISFQGEILRKQERIYNGNQIFDSQKENWIFRSHGRGIFWGIDLKETLLVNAHREASYIP